MALQDDVARLGNPAAYGYTPPARAEPRTALGALGAAFGQVQQQKDFVSYATDMIEQGAARFEAFDDPGAQQFAGLLRESPGIAMQMAEQLGGFGLMEQGFQQNELQRNILSEWGQLPKAERGTAMDLYNFGMQKGANPDSFMNFLMQQQQLELLGQETELKRAQTAGEWYDSIIGDDRPSFSDLQTAKGKFMSQSDEQQTILDAWESLPETFDRAVAGGVESTTAQQALAIKLMKILDPGSVVRESEFKLAVDSTNLSGQTVNFIKGLYSGEQINPTQLQNMVDQAATSAASAARQQSRRTREAYEMAGRHSLDPRDISADIISGSLKGLARFKPQAFEELRSDLDSFGFQYAPGARNIKTSTQLRKEEIETQLDALGVPY